MPLQKKTVIPAAQFWQENHQNCAAGIAQNI
jgi:hypothetical protein